MTFVPSSNTTDLRSAPSFEPFLLNPGNRKFFQGQVPYLSVQHWQLIKNVAQLLVIILGSMVLYLVSSQNDRIHLETTGIKVEATVIGRQTRDGGTTYTLTYQFQPANGDGSFDGKQDVAYDTYSTHPEGSHISIVYAPNDPNKSELDRDYWNLDVGSLACLGLIIIGCSLFGYIYLRRVLKDRHLARHGQIVEGKLTSIVGQRDQGEGSQGYRVTAWFSFVSPSGTKLTGNNNRTRKDLAPRHVFFKWEYDPLPEPAPTVAVISLANKTSRSL